MTAGEWRDLVERLTDLPLWAVRSEVRLDASGPARVDRARLLTLTPARGSNTIPVWDPAPALEGAAPDPDALEAWLAARRSLQLRLLGLGPSDWSRPIGHPTRGVMPLADWVREWVEEDAERRSELPKETRE